MNEPNRSTGAQDENPEVVAGAASEDAESPTRVHSGLGVRRVNNVPVIIGATLALGFATVIAIVAAHKAQQSAPPPPGAASAETVADRSNSSQAEQMAATITKKAPTAEVAPLGRPSDEVGVLTPEADGALEDGPSSPGGPPTALQQERLRILVLKRTQLEEAIKAHTAVAAAFPAPQPGGSGPPAVIADGVDSASSLAGQIDVARRQIAAQSAQALESARALSDRLDQLTQGSPASAGLIAGSTYAAGSAVPSIPAIPTGSSSNQATRPAYMTEAVGQFESKDPDRWTLTSSMSAPSSKYELRAGAVIPAILISAVNSELPGQIIAQLSENVYDTARGDYLLLPQGSRLIGEYTSNVAYGQGRLMVVWKRIVFPDAKALDIGSMPGTDGAGRGGMKDQVNNHYVRLFAGAVMLSAIEAAVVKSQPQYSAGLYPTTSQALEQSLGQQLGETATQLIQKNMNIAPTLNIRAGYRLNVMVTKDMVFSKPYEAFDYQEAQ